ncbi:lysophospholipid acyltransferase family protein [Methylophilus aquaticus]|uniref:Lysophospholipid acyltransferase family protein n=1 Tax=Methylophilus aquaticus TaxID=1971610 RepID=A0ABT9JSJ3_9PROT|nr:lysophospholipid acyltransferase family protein [Methylophilus aquaticus]MDP8567527.1 lysophospholipid acyltransferase family protein [Methylophilus aquaticus]
MLGFLCKALACLPLKWIHYFGAALGYGAYLVDRKGNRTALNNILQSGLTADTSHARHLMKASRMSAGKALIETFFIWGQPAAKLVPLVKEVHGWQLVEDVQKNGKGIIFLTPHLGCFEITSIYYGMHQPITVLYRPPKLRILKNMIISGRQKEQVTMAPANAAGVKKLLQALKAGQAIGILPDQIPKRGEGEWAPFFGKQAYTMGLASKLAQKSDATIIMAFGERLPDGAGYAIHLSEISDISTPALLNKAVEQQIARCPDQYLWQYDRYKQRRYALQKKPYLADAATAEPSSEKDSQK